MTHCTERIRLLHERCRGRIYPIKRNIGLFGASALGIGAIIGSGIFIVTDIVTGIAGPALFVSIVISGIIAIFSTMSVAELSVYLPKEGEPYAYAHQLISPFVGFIAGWIWIFSIYLSGQPTRWDLPIILLPSSRSFRSQILQW